MPREHQIVSGPDSHIGALEKRLDEAVANGFEVEQFTATPGSVYALLTREAPASKEEGSTSP